MKEKVSIIIPVYNVEKYLDKCLNSVVNQTYENIEIIVINDGSPDNSQKIIEQYQKKYSKKLRGYIKNNGGIGSSRNFGLKQATGDYIFFVDSDDWIDLNTVEIVIKEMILQKSDIAIFNMADHYSNGKIKITNKHEIEDKYEQIGSCCNKIFKKTILEDLEYIPNIWYEDLNFSMKLLVKTEKIIKIPNAFYHCTVREDSIMNNNNSFKNLDIITSLKNVEEYYKKNNYWSQNEEMFKNKILDHILFTAITRVQYQKNHLKKPVIDILRKYSKEIIGKNFRKLNNYKNSNIPKKIIINLNYYNLSNIGNMLLTIKRKISHDKN